MIDSGPLKMIISQFVPTVFFPDSRVLASYFAIGQLIRPYLWVFEYGQCLQAFSVGESQLDSSLSESY